MKGDERVLDYLNRALRHELTAVSQYWLHYRLQEDWGLGRMAKKSREESIEEMQHADKLIERIIFSKVTQTFKSLTRCGLVRTPRRLSNAISRPRSTRVRYTKRRAMSAERRATTCQWICSRS